MTPKQEKFCQLYVELGNASEAYRQAQFPPASGTKRFYTYLLIDPRDQSIFYVGKGTGKRIRQHVIGALSGRIDNPAKCARIADIHDAGMKVEEVFFSDHDDAASALSVERGIIERLKGGLTNITSGAVPDAERASLMAKHWLARMKPFDEWLNTAGPDRLASAERVYGSARACYDSIRSGFEELVI